METLPTVAEEGKRGRSEQNSKVSPEAFTPREQGKVDMLEIEGMMTEKGGGIGQRDGGVSLPLEHGEYNENTAMTSNGTFNTEVFQASNVGMNNTLSLTPSVGDGVKGGAVTGERVERSLADQNSSLEMSSKMATTALADKDLALRRSTEDLYIPTPRSHQSNDSYNSGSDLDNSFRMHSFQQESSATLVAVSPAPRESRSSFVSHGLSKLSLAESGGKLYDYKTGLRSSRGGGDSDTLTIQSNWTGTGRRGDSGANVLNVSPRLINVSSTSTDEPTTKSNSLRLLVDKASSAGESPGEFDSAKTPGYWQENGESADSAVAMVAHRNTGLTHSDVREGVVHSSDGGVLLSHGDSSPLEHTSNEMGRHVHSSVREVTPQGVRSPTETGEMEHARNMDSSVGGGMLQDVTSPMATGRGNRSMGGVVLQSVESPKATGRMEVKAKGLSVGGALSHGTSPPADLASPAAVPSAHSSTANLLVGGVTSHDLTSPPAYGTTGIQSVNSPTGTGASVTSTTALKAINLPPLRGVKQVYIGK
jgi:hypothetical protein